MNASAAALISPLPFHADDAFAVLVLAGDGPVPRVLAALRAGAVGVVGWGGARSDLALAPVRVGRGCRLRRGLRRRCPSEMAMQSPNVVELRRGSAHGAPVVAVTAAASNPRVGGRRWTCAS